LHNHRKALDVLIKAFENVSILHPTLELWLAGDGPLREELERLANSLVPNGKIKFLGFKPRKEIRRLVQRCTLFTLPSRAEPFGIAILEALACSKPVVATAVGGIPEIIQSGVTGLLVEPDNPKALAGAIEAVLTNSVLRESIARGGYEAVRSHFQWEKAGAAYETAFQRLLSNQEHYIYQNQEKR
jgi:glycosyltransferase involved in cell wall biosynthesis